MPRIVEPGPTAFPEIAPFQSPFQSKGLHAEHHVTVSQLATLWGMSDDTVRKIFQNEPGVMKISEPAQRRKRKDGTFKRAYVRTYTKMFIPESVARRVYARLTKAA